LKHGVNILLINLNCDHQDAFGRETETWHPIGAAGMTDINNHYAPRSRTLYGDIGSAACGELIIPDHADYCMLSITDGAPIVVQYFDSLNRVVQTRANAFRQNTSIQQQSVVNSTYNGRGQMVAESVPKFDNVSMTTVTHQYDPLGRMIKKSQPSTVNDPLSTMYTHYQYNGLVTTVQVNNIPSTPSSGDCDMDNNTALDDDLCVERIHASNGWMLSTIDAHGSEMNYWYDGQGNPVLVEDAHDSLGSDMGNFTMASYNSVGHRLSLDDPNMGVWSYTYNGLGEVLTQADANGQSMVFTYDDLGRLIMRSSTPADIELGTKLISLSDCAI